MIGSLGTVLFDTKKEGIYRVPRKARQRSITGYSHVIVRGIGKQILFEENKDYGYYVSLIRKYAKETGVTIAS